VTRLRAHLLAESGNAQATLFAFLLAFHAQDLRIDEHDLVRRILRVGNVDDGDLAGEADLRRGQPHPFGGVHGFEHVFEELSSSGVSNSVTSSASRSSTGSPYFTIG
jgi:hypothetical protein